MTSRKRDQSSKRKAPISLSVARALLEVEGVPCVEDWAAHFAEGIHLRVANRPVMHGAKMAAAELALLFAPVIAIGAGFRFMWAAPDDATVLAELDLALAGRLEPVPMVIVLRALEPAPVMRDLRFYLDPTPLGLPQAIPPANGLRMMN